MYRHIGGPNWDYRPLPQHTELAHILIDAGANVVYGHSPHVFRGIEIYKGRPILYSTGNFIDDYAIDEIERNDQSFIFTLETANNHLKQINLYPTLIRNLQVQLATKREAQEMANKMIELCSTFNTTARWNDTNMRLEIPISK